MPSELLTARNIKLTIAYDGTRYLGWQKTKEGPSIEESIETCLFQILQHEIHLQAASRTDAHVHAKGQVAQFFTNKPVSLKSLQISLCCLLPKDIAIVKVEEEKPEFHPTLQNIGKEYRYALCTSPFQMPQDRLYEWHYPHRLSLGLMRKAIPFFIGEMDFASFCNAKKNEEYAHQIRKVTFLEVEEMPDEKFLFVIRGNHFLYKMVRNIVGTLVYIGRGKIALGDLPQILQAKDRTLAGITAPAHGLTLMKVFFKH